MNQQNMIVIGGGASGLTAAICALRAGLDVCVLEAEATVCKKLAATGNGKCNFTHAGISGIEYYSDQPDLIREILTDYPTEHILSFASSLGISYVEKNGYFYPHAQQASAVCKA
nr:FAD-dependent oxidoreductase [Lachnospiraceae bacterium]